MGKEYARPRLMGRSEDVSLKEEELLVRLAEEAAEVIQRVTKTLRFGWASKHPNEPEETNEQALIREADDFADILLQLAIERAESETK